jgi:hypothetical protein
MQHENINHLMTRERERETDREGERQTDREGGGEREREGGEREGEKRF